MAVDIFVQIGALGIIIFAGFFASLFFQRTKIPDVLLLVALGMLIGPILGVFDASVLIGFAPLIGTIALIIIVFEGGLKLNFYYVLRALPEATWFTTLVCVLTALLSMFALMLAGWNWVYALLFGFVIAGTSYEIIVHLLGKISGNEELKTMLNLESALNDAITIVGVIAIIEFVSTIHEMNALNPLQSIASAFSIAIVLGAVGGFAWARIWQKLKGSSFGYLSTLGFVFVLFALVELLKGNGITAILVFGLMLGNFESIANALGIKSKFNIDGEINAVQTEVSFFVRTMFFVYMGVVFSFSSFVMDNFIIALVVFIAIVVARFASARILAWAHKGFYDSRQLITAMLPRGLATAVLATYPIRILQTNTAQLASFADITLIIIILTNIWATISIFLYERGQSKKLKAQ